jgi:uncharacterized membrane protein SirB2
VINELLVQFAEWLYATGGSRAIEESYYMYNWIEATHVLTVMLSLGMLVFIDLRMLGLAMPGVSAAKIADRLNIPMMVGFGIMFITGLLLFYAKPTYTINSIWFRIKMVLLLVAFVNAIMFHKRMKASVGSWEHERKAPRHLQISAALSLGLWAGVVTTGRLIAYDWYHCYKELSPFMNWAAGCVAD